MLTLGQRDTVIPILYLPTTTVVVRSSHGLRTTIRRLFHFDYSVRRLFEVSGPVPKTRLAVFQSPIAAAYPYFPFNARLTSTNVEMREAHRQGTDREIAQWVMKAELP